jgi:hypothetical protein
VSPKVIVGKNSSPRRLGGTLAPGLLNIVTAAEAAGWSVRRDELFVELFKPASEAGACAGYQINSRWWCHALPPTGKRYEDRAFRVTAPSLMRLLGLPMQG